MKKIKIQIGVDLIGQPIYHILWVADEKRKKR